MTSIPGCSFLRLYAAASLKLGVGALILLLRGVFSAALCRGLIEATMRGLVTTGGSPFSAALCRGLIEATRRNATCSSNPRRFPRLYAAASLKLDPENVHINQGWLFSAALCRGLIEAGAGVDKTVSRSAVFRGFMPRPH